MLFGWQLDRNREHWEKIFLVQESEPRLPRVCSRICGEFGIYFTNAESATNTPGHVGSAVSMAKAPKSV